DIETTMELKKDLEKDNLDNLATLAIRLARTSGNIFQIDNDGKVSSVLKEVKKKEEKRKRKN
ncbi:21912_t:CDS:1, partial [Rhizophagus irregularis]